MYKKLFIILGLSCIITCILAACGAGTSSTNTTGTTTTAGTEVHMNSTNFVQTSITIKKGQSVTLVDDDALTPHIIANGTWENGTAKPAKEPNAPEVKNVQINGNASGIIGPFTSAGTFHLYCTIHTGMNLTVVVQ